MAQGNIGVTSDNIFPVIKKFLYSDHEIFLRELVSNAVDATQKLKTLASVGEAKGELGDMRVYVNIDKNKKTLTISDHGIGMSADEVDKYINQIAFSGAEEFVNKYKDNAQAIIGHFGLGFYSAFMVSKKVEIFSQSYREDEKAVHWSCDGSPVYQMEDTIKADRGTDIVLHLDDENLDFLEDSKIQGLLTKYCKFLPVEIVFGKKKEWKDGREQETDQDNVINNVNPAWTRKPSELKEEDYKEFYHQLYPNQLDEPLFHIHLNVDYPFHLTGILYFPRIKNNLDIHRNKIQLYCNQVFVTDEVENIVPEYLTLLHGVIDSPDIPLNVSRSYLQSDQNVKKISSHITKKVADRLAEIFKNEREDFEKKWDDIKLFIQFGMLSDEKFYERANKFALYENIDHQYFTFDEYKDKIKEQQTDKDGNLICLYAQDVDASYAYIQRAKQKGYDVLLMNGELDVHFISQTEQKNTDYSADDNTDKKAAVRFVRIDSDTIENLIRKDAQQQVTLNDEQQEALRFSFESQLPKNDKTNYFVSFEAVSADAMPVFLTQNEFMRRMKEMSARQQGMSFYGQMPDQYNFVLNTEHPLITQLAGNLLDAAAAEIAPLNEQITAKQNEEQQLRDAQKDKKEDELTTEEKEAVTNITKQIAELREQKKQIFSQLAAANPQVGQLIDIALLAAGLLKGEPLAQFLNRTIQLL
ncbi:MAG: molecular chaperone HtpG [Paludibacter sp.]|nr:molecular chaperone HtpG [Bacteroidales bacterium]MCM1069178.1 molecular chaperone HtpG [Prevotella sp.]MCM1354083.1 molecular chaperone HtpG [Bacteroides sp.]MCM1442944.1 molecular chaperone HtpG [Muribaculum sp.]MCM1481733.1 molecular chaperone HtpG [Paludibacter sp.]